MAEYMDSLEVIAPVLRLATVSEDGLVEAIRGNAKTVGTIFGETEQVDALLAQYDLQSAPPVPNWHRRSWRTRKTNFGIK